MTDRFDIERELASVEREIGVNRSILDLGCYPKQRERIRGRIEVLEAKRAEIRARLAA